MPRAIWSGAISFGLVNVPVRMYSAVAEHKLHFNYVHVKDGSRIGGTISAPEPDEPAEAPDFMAALQASIDRSGSRSSNGDRNGNGELEQLSKDALYERAKAEELVAALSAR